MSDKKLYIYYSFLLIILMIWKNDYAPNFILRICFLIAVIYPTLQYRKTWLPPVLICFWGISSNGYAYSFMPMSQDIYAGIFLYLYFKKYTLLGNKIRFYGYNTLCAFLILIVIVDFINNVEITNIAYSLFVIIMMTHFIDNKNKNIIKQFDIAFIIMSLVISYYSLSTRAQFAVTGSELERVGWTDPNYLGMTIGMGTVIAINNLFSFNKNSLLFNVLCVVTSAISFVVLLNLASRGAILCVVVAVTIIILFKRTHVLIKILLPLVLIVFMIYLYDNNYFAIIESRLQEDGGSADVRYWIWDLKLRTFIDQNPFILLFGNGFSNAYYLGSKVPHGFHNDYIAILCEYGLIGLCLFLYMFIFPFKQAKLSNVHWSNVAPFIFYMLIAFCTLEPMTLAKFSFWAFYLYIIISSKFGNIKC